MRRIWTALAAPALIVPGLLATGCTTTVAGTGVWDSAGPAGEQVTSTPSTTSAPASTPPVPSTTRAAPPAAPSPAAPPPVTSTRVPAPPSHPAPRPAPTHRTTPPPAPDLGPCYDGSCQVLVRRPVVIPLNPRFGFSRLSVTAISASQVTFEGTLASGGYAQATVSSGGTATLDQISIHVVSLSARGAVLRLSPA